MEVLSEKYRPICINDLVFTSDDQKTKLEEIVKNKKLNTHMIFSGNPGLGKTSTINVLINELGITDYMKINGSDKTGIDDTRKIIEYASIPPLFGQKVVIFEEFERLSPQAQDSLKLPMDQYSGWCIFLFTTNKLSKVSDPIKSRCEIFDYETLNMNGFIKRVIDILMNEKIKFYPDDITKYVNYTYPDLRKCINVINNNITTKIIEDAEIKELNKLEDKASIKPTTFTTIVNVFKEQGSIKTKELLISEMEDDDYEKMYLFLSNNLELLTDKKEKWDDILVLISDYLYKNKDCSFKFINLVAFLIEVRNTING